MSPVDYSARADSGRYEKRASASVAGVGTGSYTPLVTDVQARGPGFILMRNDGADSCVFEIAFATESGGTYTVHGSQIASTSFASGEQRYEELPATRPAFVRVRAKADNTTTTAYAEVHSVSD